MVSPTTSLLIVCNGLYGRAITRGRLARTQITLCQQLCFCRKRVLKGLFCQKKHGKGISTRQLFWSLPPPSPWLRPWAVSLRKSHFIEGYFPMLLFYELNSIVCQSESITLHFLPHCHQASTNTSCIFASCIFTSCIFMSRPTMIGVREVFIVQ